MSDAAAAVPAPAPTSWPMTAQEARDITVAQLRLNELQAHFNTIGTAASKRLGLPDGTAMRFNIDKCEWEKAGPTALPRADEANGPTEK